jgi:ZIP family zinc transporter
MLAAFGWGALGASALLIGALIAYRLAPSRSVIAAVMALGTGLLIGSVSFELIDEALKTRTVAWVALLALVGAAVFTIGDWLLTPPWRRRAQGLRRGASRRITAGDRARLGP